MIVLGINAYHGDASACLVRDGVLVAAAEEERFRRIKHWAGFPSEAIRYCLADAGIVLGEVDVVAINQDAGANLWKKLAYMVMRRPDLSLVLERIRNKRERVGVGAELARVFPGENLRAEVREVEHHLAHLGSAFLVSPFDDAVVVSVDGFGDFASAAWGLGRGNRIEAEDKVYFPHSLGLFYQALTQYLGFPNYGDEYKVMGLAPYGEPRFMGEMRQMVKLEQGGAFRLNLDYFRHHLERIAYEWDNGEPIFADLYSPRMVELLGPARGKDEELTQRHQDLAWNELRGDRPGDGPPTTPPLPLPTTDRPGGGPPTGRCCRRSGSNRVWHARLTRECALGRAQQSKADFASVQSGGRPSRLSTTRACPRRCVRAVAAPRYLCGSLAGRGGYRRSRDPA